jgi:hypothetical protein
MTNYPISEEIYTGTKENLHKEVLKGTRWLLLKNPENLDTEKRENERLEEALKLNEPLSCAHYLKEDLRQIWLQPNKEKAEKILADWIENAQTSGIKMLMKFANTLAAYKSGILAYYDYRISSGPLEGTNNKIKTGLHPLNDLKEYLRGIIGIAAEIILTGLGLRICLRPVSEFGERPCLYPQYGG